MIKLKDLLDEISSNGSSYLADAGESDTGYTANGKPRTLGVDKTKPEPWFEKGGYTQIDFPVADRAYDKDDKSTQMVYVIKRIKNVGDKYDGLNTAIASWEKWGDSDYSTDFTEADLDKLLKAEKL
tara:strand:- start:1176 stop:1553 length:378 start_codon:yes stop_codon:yes gene_type:complete